MFGRMHGAGYDGSNRVNDFYEFNFNRRLWSAVTASGLPPNPRDRHVAVVYKDSFYVFAGFDGSSRVNDFIEYNFCTCFLSTCVPGERAALRRVRLSFLLALPSNSVAEVEQRGSGCWHAADSSSQSRCCRVR